MRLPRRAEYGLRALIDLGIAAETGRPLLRAAEIARRERIPVKFLERILHELRGAGYLTARRGRRGGYALARPMARICMGDALRSLVGTLALLDCVASDEGRPCSCPDRTHCGLRLLMDDVHHVTARVLDRFTLADVVRITVRKIRRSRLPVPFPLPGGPTDETAPARPRVRRPAGRRLRRPGP